MDETQREALLDQLTADSRAYGRAEDAFKRARDRLGDTMRSARAAGIGPAEITRRIEHRLTEKTVIRETKGIAEKD